MNTQHIASKVHISLDTNNINESIRYYATLFNMEPTKVKPGYAKFDVADPAINLTLGQTSATVTGPNHMGIRMNTLDEVIAAKDRLEKAGFTTMDEMGTTCCYAVQDKVWSSDPSGNRWEVYIFKGDAEKFGAAPKQNDACSPGGACCTDGSADQITDQSAQKHDAKQNEVQQNEVQQNEVQKQTQQEAAALAGLCCSADSRSPEERKTSCC